VAKRTGGEKIAYDAGAWSGIGGRPQGGFSLLSLVESADFAPEVPLVWSLAPERSPCPVVYVGQETSAADLKFLQHIRQSRL